MYTNILTVNCMVHKLYWTGKLSGYKPCSYTKEAFFSKIRKNGFRLHKQKTYVVHVFNIKSIANA